MIIFSPVLAIMHPVTSERVLSEKEKLIKESDASYSMSRGGIGTMGAEYLKIDTILPYMSISRPYSLQRNTSRSSIRELVKLQETTQSKSSLTDRLTSFSFAIVRSNSLSRICPTEISTDSVNAGSRMHNESISALTPAILRLSRSSARQSARANENKNISRMNLFISLLYQ